MTKTTRQAEEEYNKMAQGYADATKRAMRVYSYEPTVVKYIQEEIKGAKVLDLACGEGVSSRLFQSMGAESVLGLDISQDLINIANSTPRENVEYGVADVFSDDLSKYGKFDVVTAIMLIHYANSRKELEFFMNNVLSCLKDSGVLYLLTVTPTFLKTGYKNYGVRLTPEGSEESSSVLVELHDFDWKKYCEFHINYYSKETYNKLFDEYGLDIEWLPGVVSPEGIKEFGEDFWKEYLSNPVYSIIKARRRNK